MSFLKNKTILFDLAHKEMLNIEENEFSGFLSVLQRVNITILNNENKDLTGDLLNNVDILFIGNPINDFFSNVEIKSIVDYVRQGGHLLLISEYGSDYLQKTNLNDLTGKHFGIFFEKDIVKEQPKINQNCTSILHVQDFPDNKITDHVREIIIGGTCSFFINKNAKPLIKSSGLTWTEIYNDATKQWTKESEHEQIIGAYTKFGKGKVVALGDIDVFTNDPNIGINQLDNKKFISNILNWLMEPIKESDVTFWILNQLGSLQNEIKEINNKINNIIETLTFLDRRMSLIEENSVNMEENAEYKKIEENKQFK